MLSITPYLSRSLCLAGTSVIQVTATDADDPTYGNSAKLVYTLVHGHEYFSVDPQTGGPAVSRSCFSISPDKIFISTPLPAQLQMHADTLISAPIDKTDIDG